jgi:tetratricopeptide (TPR) repeat protein
LIGADLSRVENGVGLFAMSSGLFSYSGISMKISRKIIERAEQSIDPEDTRALLYYRLAKLMHHLVAGEWEKIEAYDPDLLDQGLKFGELWATTTYCLFYGWVKACTGKYAENQLIDDKVSEISNTFEDDFSKSTRFIIRTELFWEFGKIEQAVTEVDAAIKFFSDMNYRAYLSEQYAYKARLHLLSHEPEKADECFRISQEIAREGHPAPMTSLVCQLGLCSRELNQLEELRKNRDTESFGRTRRTASKIVRKTVRLTKKVIYKSVEAYRLEGRLRWIKGNRKKAFKSWQRSIDVGQSLGLLPELARTFSEIGRRLIESDGRRASWNGVHAEEYLHKAEEIFTRLNMEWDLGALKEEENP